MKIIVFSIFLSFLLTTETYAQTTIPIQTDLIKGGYYGPTKTVVKLDPISNIPIGNVPFDRSFVVRVYFLNAADIPKEVYLLTKFPKTDNVKLGFYSIITVPAPVSPATTPVAVNATDYDPNDTNFKFLKYAIDILVPPFLPNRKYSLLFVSDQSLVQYQEYLNVFKMIFDGDESGAKKTHEDYRKNSANSSTPAFDELKKYYTDNNIATIFTTHNGELNLSSPDLLAKMKAVDYVIRADGNQVKCFQNITTATNLSTKQYTVQTSAALSIVADGGIIFTGFQKGFNTVSPYIGINYSFRPLDSDIPFSYLVRNRYIAWYQRFTVNLGITLNSIAKTNYRTNIFGNDNIMAGFGFKFSHVISITGGGLFYQNIDPNPLLSKQTLGVTPYVGLSINLKIKDALGDIAKVFTYGK